jgi:hypothetical protein
MNKYSYLFYLYYYTLNHILRYEIQYLKIWGGTNNASLLSAKCAIRVSQKHTTSILQPTATHVHEQAWVRSMLYTILEYTYKLVLFALKQKLCVS